MNITNAKEKIKGKLKKAGRIGKKGIIAFCALLIVGVAVLLNFVLIDKSPAVDMSDDLEKVSVLLDSDDGDAFDDFFESAILNRQIARDEAIQVLQDVTDSTDAVEEVRSGAYSDIQQIAKDIESEANIEALIKSKGFETCIAVVNGTNASVIVKSEGLSAGEVAQISEIVWNEAGVLPTDLKIIEK